MGTPQYTLNSSKLWQSQGTEGVNNLTASDDPNIYSSESAQKSVHIQSVLHNCSCTFLCNSNNLSSSTPSKSGRPSLACGSIRDSSTLAFKMVLMPGTPPSMEQFQWLCQLAFFSS